MQDAKEFKLTYSQNTLGQPHLHKKGKERNERETKKKRKGTYEYVYRTFSTIRVFPVSFLLGPPLISISDFQMSAKEMVSSWQKVLLLKNIHKTPGLWLRTHRVSVTLPAGTSLLNDKLPEVFPSTSYAVIKFQGHVSVFYTVSHFVPLIPCLSVSIKEAYVTKKKKKWFGWSKANPTQPQPSCYLCHSVTLFPAWTQKNGSCKGS